MHILARLDDWIITTKFEPIAWHLEYRWNIRTSRICRILRAFSILMLVPPVTYESGALQAAVVILIAGVMDSTLGQMLEKVQNRNAKTPNPEKLYWPIRYSIFIPSVFLGGVVAHATGDATVFYGVTAVGATFTSVLYFSACDSLPPKVRNQYEARGVERYLTTQEI